MSAVVSAQPVPGASTISARPAHPAHDVILNVRNLSKHYPAFDLLDVGFSLEEGSITGFIGRNGAGKTTTLKCLVNMVHPTSGTVEVFGDDFSENEYEIKQSIGVVFGGVDFYPKKRIDVIAQVTKHFFSQWDDALFERYTSLFSLDPQKTPDELSAGMRVKFMLALALSHHARLLILDEPTSGLDPVSRDDLLDVFMRLCDEEGVTILFSTHITTDLEKCADRILYLSGGRLRADEDLDDYLDRYRLVSIPLDELTADVKEHLAGCTRTRRGYSGLLERTQIPYFEEFPQWQMREPDLESIMIHVEKGV